MALLDLFKKGLEKTKKGLIERMGSLFSVSMNESSFEQLEEALLLADVGPKATVELLGTLREEAKRSNHRDIRELLRESMLKLLGAPVHLNIPETPPAVILMVGVNGVGKTTTIGKLSHRFRLEGKKVIIAASDTFRAAAIEQLEVWAKRTDAQLIKHQMGSDPAAVAFDAIQSARARNAEVVIIDTAGRLHTKSPLMEELKKIKRVIQKAIPEAPHESLLVLDATTGQNALNQARLFNDAIGVTGIALTKLDGTSKGGMVFAIKKELNIPVKLIGLGEGIEDLADFKPEEFVDALLQ
ncbi:MAG: signal recognition particle-docking protein FtsY [Thermodesulfovibrionales bacterium]|nr:signal recognition particle-docking protein FtsY [Thermodesulfovibrionales bacterium]